MTLTVVLSPGTVAACPTCFGSVSQQVLYTYYLSAVFLTLMPFFVLSMLGTWIVRHHRKQRTNAGMPGPVPPRSAR